MEGSKSPAQAVTLQEDPRAVVIAWPTMDGLADFMVSQYPALFRKGSIQWDYFPDGWPNIHFEHLSSLQGKRVIFLGSLYDRTKFVEQLSMVMVLPRQFVHSLAIVFPYFGPATMERVDEEGVVATAETVAKLLASAIPMTKKGPASLRIFDIHASTVRFYFPDTVMMRMMRAAGLLISHLKSIEATEGKIVIAYPDDGAAKRFKPSFPDMPGIVCSKIREGETRIIRITDRINWTAETNMDHVLIIDDLVQSGGTLDECRKALVSSGAKKVSAFVTHPVFPRESWAKFLPGAEREGFHRFYVTNTIPEVASQLEGKAPFHVLKIDDFLAQDLIKELGLEKKCCQK